MGSSQQQPETDLYSVIFTCSKLKHDPTSQMQKVRVCGTFTSLKAAKAVAHRTLFDAGYEQDWFPIFDARADAVENWKWGDGVIVYAEAPEGDVFTVSIDTTANMLGLQGGVDDHKVHEPLFHVLQTTIHYDEDASGSVRDTRIEATFRHYKNAVTAAKVILLNYEDGIRPESFAEYDVLPEGERDWEYGTNVIVHAVGLNGHNVLVSVVKEEEMEAVRLMEATMEIRA